MQKTNVYYFDKFYLNTCIIDYKITFVYKYILKFERTVNFVMTDNIKTVKHVQYSHNYVELLLHSLHYCKIVVNN